MKNKNKEYNIGDELDNSFFNFIDKLAEIGGYARTEQSHSEFTHTDKDTATSIIKEYEDFLKVVNAKFDKVKDKLKEVYN